MESFQRNVVGQYSHIFNLTKLMLKLLVKAIMTMFHVTYLFKAISNLLTVNSYVLLNDNYSGVNLTQGGHDFCYEICHSV